MVNIVKFYENIQQKTGLFDMISFHRKYSYLKKYKDKKLLIVGSKKHPKYDTCESFKPLEIEKSINNYDIIVIDKYFCNLSTSDIKSILNLIKRYKKDSIFIGYSSILNININNTNNMFRPIDITKYPFEVKNAKIIHKSISLKLLILYIFCVIMMIIGNYHEPRFLYKFALLLLILVISVFPIKKVLFLKYQENKENLI